MDLPIFSEGMIIVTGLLVIAIIGAVTWGAIYWNRLNRKRFLILTILPIAFVAFYILFYLNANLAGRSQVKKERAAMAAKKIPLSKNDLHVLYPSRKEDNAAPIYKVLLEKINNSAICEALEKQLADQHYSSLVSWPEPNPSRPCVQ